jgi:hypothetical protein
VIEEGTSGPGCQRRISHDASRFCKLCVVGTVGMPGFPYGGSKAEMGGFVDCIDVRSCPYNTAALELKLPQPRETFESP